jgi:hypothetical protein
VANHDSTSKWKVAMAWKVGEATKAAIWQLCHGFVAGRFWQQLMKFVRVNAL